MSSTGRNVTLCIVNYEGAGNLPRALAASRRSATPFNEILVVDNGSTDGGIAWLRRECPEVRILELETNRGPAAARNAGFAAARHDLILFQDNDVQLGATSAGTLLDTLLAASRALLVAPRVLYAADPAIVQYDSADCHFLGLMATRHAERAWKTLDADIARTTSLVTACFLIDRSRWRDGAPFDEWFGFNLEDHDFGVRACILGHELLVAPAATVLHGAGTAGLSYRPGGTVPVERVFYLIRNRWSVMTKAFALRSLVVLSPVLLIYELLQLVGAASNGWLRQWVAALRSWWRELPRLRRDRSALQRARVAGDALVLCGGPLPLTAAVRNRPLARFAIGALQRVVNAYWRVARPFI
ncbi:MAG TPA: glycosyltransferase [Vicinamibacterales bacterium]|nr:glycosyltransferase [Vicinamibacterales bacterium]